MKKVNHTLTEQLVRKLADEQVRTGLSASEIIRRALDGYFEKFGSHESVGLGEDRHEGKNQTPEPAQRKNPYI